MSKILKRPMFRIGGRANEEGIISMAQPRKNYQEGSDYQRRIEELRPIFQAAAGQGRSRDDRLSDLLISGGLNLMSARPSGNIFSTAAGAFKEPTSQFLKGRETEDAFQRQINLAAATQGISSVEAERLQRMKVEAAQAEAIQRAEQIDKELFLKTSGLGTSAGSIYETKRALEKKGEVVIGAVPTIGSGDTTKPTPSSVLSIPEGRVFYDVNGNFYRKVPKDQSQLGWKRIQLSGEDIKTGAPVKPTGFFAEVKEKGASYDPRSWNKQKFYEQLSRIK